MIIMKVIVNLFFLSEQKMLLSTLKYSFSINKMDTIISEQTMVVPILLTQ